MVGIEIEFPIGKVTPCIASLLAVGQDQYHNTMELGWGMALIETSPKVESETTALVMMARYG